MTSKVKVTIYRGARKEWRWTVSALNGRIVGASSEGYRSRKRCEDNLHVVTGFLVLMTTPREDRGAPIIRRFYPGARLGTP